MKHRGLFLTLATLGAVVSASAQTTPRRAALLNVTDPYEGRCSATVVVDGAADLEIRGDNALLRTVTGLPPQWRRFDCTAAIPDNPVDLRLRAIQGDGRLQLTRDSRNAGAVVVRVTNLQGGDEMFTFDILWDRRRSTTTSDTADRAMVDDEDAIQSCRNAVETRIRDDGYRRVEFPSVRMSDRPGSTDMVMGTATANRVREYRTFNFSCRVNVYDGRVQWVDVTRR